MQLLALRLILEIVPAEVDEHKISQTKAVWDRFVGQLALTVHVDSAALVWEAFFKENVDLSRRERSHVIFTEDLVLHIEVREVQII